MFLDSDCIVPPGYLEEVNRELNRRPTDAFGGPDRACDTFSTKQKAIDYSMTSFLTTGGIRGRKKSLDKFYPRSFNMGIDRAVFDSLGGFSRMRFGEDIDLSYRLIRNGFHSRLFPDAWVHHKRRSNFRQFFKQVFNSGIARVRLSREHRGTLKFVHTLPALFTVAGIFLLIASIREPWLLLFFVIFSCVILIDAAIRTKSLAAGFLSVVAAFTQLTGYGSGFIYGLWMIFLLKKHSHTAFDKNFYK